MSLARFLDVDEAHGLLPHVDLLLELGIPLPDAFELAASEVSLRDCRELLEQGCAPELVAAILA